MTTFRLTAVTADGRGLTYGWGDTYEVEARDYAAAKADVLGREGTDGSQPYTEIVRAWSKIPDRHFTHYVKLDTDTGYRLP